MDKQFAVFDLDGTLADSMVCWAELAGEFLKKRGIHPVPEGIADEIKTMTMAESAALFVRTFGLEDTPEQVAGEMNAMIEEHYRKDIPLKDGAGEYIRRLASQGVRMCVASATDRHLVSDCLKRLGILPYFEFLISCEEVGRGKDSPRVYEEAARRFGAQPGEIAVYEDALFAARTARQAGFYVVGVYDRGSKDFNQLKQMADEVVLSWRDCLG